MSEPNVVVSSALIKISMIPLNLKALPPFSHHLYLALSLIIFDRGQFL